jgi:hypothetical protein
VAIPGSSQWQLQLGRDGHSWPLTHAAWPSERLIAGSPHSTQRFIFDGDVQRKAHSFVDYVRFAPSNFRVSSMSRSVLGFKASLFYTVPCLQHCWFGPLYSYLVWSFSLACLVFFVFACISAILDVLFMRVILHFMRVSVLARCLSSIPW